MTHPIPPGPWTLEAGRSIVTPQGTFFLTYGQHPKTGAPNFPNFCALDATARAVAELPGLCEALSNLVSRWDRGETPIASDWSKAREALARARGQA